MFAQPPRVRTVALLIGLVAVVLTGCAGSAGQSSEAAGEPSADLPGSERPIRTDAPAEPVPSVSAPAIVGEVPADLLEQILTNAADQADVDIDAIEVLRAEAVTWTDGSLGCPEPGMLYTQALVDGYHVVVDAGGTELDYRATTNGDYRICEGGGPPSGG